MFKIGDLVKIVDSPFGNNGLLAIVTETHYDKAYEVCEVLILKTNKRSAYNITRLEAV